MSDKELAQMILKNVGGKENVKSIAHCATRLRIVVKNKDKINVKEIENLDKVKGSFFNSGQYQIILGTGLVNRIYDEVIQLVGEISNIDNNEEENYGNKFQRAIRMFSDVFVPIIPVLVATGLFMGLRGLLTQEAILNVFGLTLASIPQELLIFTQILTDTAFAFLPALICWSAFKNFGGSPVIGIVLGLMLVSPNLPNAYEVGQGTAEPMVFFGFIKVAGYQGSVLPAFVTGLIGAKFEKWIRRYIPDAIDLIVTPFLTMLVGIILALFVIGPVLHYVENGVLAIVQFIIFLPIGLGGLLYGCFGQLLGIFGIHHVLNFLEISMLAQDGWNYLNPIGTCGNVAQAGAVLAVAIKAKSNKTKQVAYPSCLSALLGITEPAVFGVNLRFVKPFIMAMIGGGVGGFLASLLGLKATGMSITGIPGTLLYLNEQLPLYVLVNLIAFFVAFILTYLFGYKEKNEDSIQKPIKEEKNETNEIRELKAYVDGKVIAMTDVKDPMFSIKALGDGVAIIPEKDIVYAPCDAFVTMIMKESKHAIGLTAANGMEILLHIGIDTVNLKGDGFELFVKEGDYVKQGQKIMEFDRKLFESKGIDTSCILAVTNSDLYPNAKFISNKAVKHNDDTICEL